jgi:tRNA(Ile)-lysidine synthase
VSRLLDEVGARCRFPEDGPVTCAVSGGADSLALLALARHAGLDATAVHLDHGLRPGSSSEAEVVSRAAERLGAGFRSLAVQVPPGPDLEQRARIARRAALGPAALYGHTADDQAETVLLALLRGTGLDGLAAMSEVGHPLLRVRRHETEAVCEILGLDVVHDPSNDDARFRRNRVRAEVLPLLADVAERDVVPVLCRLADLARADSQLLDELASAIDPSSAAELAGAPAPLARRAVRRWLRPMLPERHPPDLAAVERVLGVARGDAVAAEVAGGVSIRRSRGLLRAVRAGGGAAGGGEQADG